MRARKRIKAALSLATALALALSMVSPVLAVTYSAATTISESVTTLTMSLSNGSSYAGTINDDNTAGSIALTLDADSALSLTGDSYVTSLTNSDSHSGSSDSYNLSENAVITIDSDGSYTITGSSTDGCITVEKGVTATLTLSDITLTSETTGYAPVICSKNSDVTLIIDGTVTLTDNEDSEGAAIKAKSGASLKIQGDGILNVYGTSKNGIKGAATSTVTVKDGVSLNIEAANNGLAADGSVIIQGGTLDITAANDGIKASPEDDDTESAGTITIYDGNITVDAESDGINAAGDITIYGGTFTINAQSDGIQTDSNLTISDGTFHITTLNGYESSGFDSDTMSCKGLKASAGSDDTSSDSDTDASSDDDTADATNTITITGGTFVLNTADDAIHSDAYIEITGGKFTIQTGDDGAHADTSLILGTDGGTIARDPDMTINNSYEGLEAGTVYIYSGRYYVIASDDGINAAGGSTDGNDNPGGFPGGDHFNPGGGGPGGRPMMFGGVDGAELFADTAYSLNIAGGNVYVNAEGDGLDSNGTLTLSGGNIVVWGPRSGTANAALDADGTILINGATVFAAGSSAMIESPSAASQTFYSRSANISAGALVQVTDSSGNVVFNDAAVNRAVNYVIYSAPDMTSSNGYTVTATSGAVSCATSHSWNHTWNSGVTTEATTTAAGLRTYTCSVCGETETETIPQLVSIPEDKDDGGDTEEDTGYTVTFVTDEHCTINVYYTQDYAAPDETNVTSAVSRTKKGVITSTDGQVNFEVVPDDGYETASVSGAPESNYNQLKGSDETGAENIYRMTKITGAVTVTVTTTASGDATVTITGIEVKTAPTKTSYAVGDTFDPSGLVLTATYSDASAADVTYGTNAGITFSGFDSSTTGTKTITATYEGQAATFTVTVVETQSETISIAVPIANTGLKHTGNEQTGVPSGTGYTLGGTYAATNVGDYTAIATLNDGYAWTDGTSEVKEISWSIARANGPAAPTGLSGVAPTTENGANGQITGTSTDMEYSVSSAFSSASDCSANATTGLSAGTYYVRYKQTATTEAGAAVAVTVPAYSASGGSGDSGSGDSSASGGCYVATSVYGSYDCPEVWTLRRFRDNVLAETWYGRLFIRAYYAVSPAAVKLFGNAAWFQNFWRGQLDNLVSNLQADGFESTPYEDQSW